jgi:hypothetical protein
MNKASGASEVLGASRVAQAIDRPGAGVQRAAALPLPFIAALAAMVALPAIRENPRLIWSFAGASAGLVLWYVWLIVTAAAQGRRLAIDVDLRKQHYLQACAQGSVLLYWGFYWREVYHSWHLIVAQLLFAYAFDMLLAWSRRDTYTLGFAPFPVIFSTNLFLWFKPDWFYFQFLLVGVGFAAKELIRWEKSGRRVHIFNPSSFPLGVFSLALLLTASTDLTWGQEIATTLNNAPHIYLMIFLIGLPGQFLFGVTTMTMSAVATMYAFGLLYFALTGTYYFVDSYIPIAVFLGMHLLFTDPSTSPRSELGRLLFGMLYAVSVIALYYVLSRLGMPTFYDKLMAVPILNLAIKAIDRLATGPLRRLDPAAWARGLVGRQRNLAYIGVWTVAFIGMSAAQAVGDTHRGQWVQFWMNACEEGRPNACRHAAVLTSSYCRAGSGWACNEYGFLVQPDRRPDVAARAFEDACEVGFAAGCDNLDNLKAGLAEEPRRLPPTDDDYRILLRGRKGGPVGLTPLELHQRACAQGFAEGCRQACAEGDASLCAASKAETPGN